MLHEEKETLHLLRQTHLSISKPRVDETSLQEEGSKVNDDFRSGAISPSLTWDQALSGVI